MTLPILTDLFRAGHLPGEPGDTVCLDYEARFLRRRRIVTEAGRALLVDLPETVSLNDGDALGGAGGALIGIVAAEEPLLRISGDLPRLAWHIGNRHTPCQIAGDHLLIRDDHVLAGMVVKLGGGIEPIVAPFAPEGGAYGHGRTMDHAHGAHHGHDPGPGPGHHNDHEH